VISVNVCDTDTNVLMAF